MCQARGVGAILRLLRLDGLVHDTACNRAIARSEEKIGRWGLSPSTKARRVQTRQSRADRRRLFFFPVQYASLHNPPRARKETSKRPSWLSRARHTKIPAADKACSHPHEMPPRRRRRGCRFSLHAQIVNPVDLFFFLKQVGRDAHVAAVQVRRKGDGRHAGQRDGAHAEPVDSRGPIRGLFRALLWVRHFAYLARGRRDDAVNPRGHALCNRATTTRRATPNKRAGINSSQIRPCQFVYSRR